MNLVLDQCSIFLYNPFLVFFSQFSTGLVLLKDASQNFHLASQYKAKGAYIKYNKFQQQKKTMPERLCCLWLFTLRLINASWLLSNDLIESFQGKQRPCILVLAPNKACHMTTETDLCLFVKYNTSVHFHHYSTVFSTLGTKKT